VSGLPLARPRRSTLVLLAVFLVALVTYVFVRPDRPDPTGVGGVVTGVVQQQLPRTPAPTQPPPEPSPTPEPEPTPEPAATAEVTPSPTSTPPSASSPASPVPQGSAVEPTDPAASPSP